GLSPLGSPAPAYGVDGVAIVGHIPLGHHDLMFGATGTGLGHCCLSPLGVVPKWRTYFWHPLLVVVIPAVGWTDDGVHGVLGLGGHEQNISMNLAVWAWRSSSPVPFQEYS